VAYADCRYKRTETEGASCTGSICIVFSEVVSAYAGKTCGCRSDRTGGGDEEG
jgi:hypothetical protein